MHKRSVFTTLFLILILSLSANAGMFDWLTGNAVETGSATSQPVAISCTDSDGLNYETKGTVTFVSEGMRNSHIDSCNIPTTSGGYSSTSSCSGINCYVSEEYCNENVPAYEMHICPTGCSNGACLKSPVTESPAAVNTCRDSDGGNDFYKKGTLTITNNQNPNFPLGYFVGTDYCALYDATSEGSSYSVDSCGSLPINHCQVREFYCAGDTSVGLNIDTCPNGCRDGACLGTTAQPNPSSPPSADQTTTQPTEGCLTEEQISVEIQNCKNNGMDFNIYQNNCKVMCIAKEPSICPSDSEKISQANACKNRGYDFKGVLDKNRCEIIDCTDRIPTGDVCPPQEQNLVEYEKCKGFGIEPTPVFRILEENKGIDDCPYAVCIKPTVSTVPVKKCGMNSFSVNNLCTNAATGSSNFRNAYFQCYDGVESYQGDPTSCKPSELWQEYGKKFCENHCNDVKITPVPTATPVPIVQPVEQPTCSLGTAIWLTENHPLITKTSDGVQHAVEVLDVTDANDACQVKVDDVTAIVDVNEQKTISGVLLSILGVTNSKIQQTNKVDVCQICTSNWQIQQTTTQPVTTVPTTQTTTQPVCPSAIEVNAQIQKCKDAGLGLQTQISADSETNCMKVICEKTATQESIKCNACLVDNACLPIGTRFNKQFCDVDNKMKDIKIDSAECSNSFECTSNLCINDACVSGSLWNKIMSWFSKLF